MKPRFSLLLFALTASAGATVTWNGTTSNGWAVAGNWNPGLPASGEDVVIADTTANSLVLDASHAIGNLTFGTGGTRTAAFSVTTGAANNLTINGGLTANGAFTTIGLSILGNITLPSAQTWTIAGSAGTVSADAGVAVREVTAATTAGTFALNGDLTKQGPGQLLVIGTTVSGAGNFVVNEGVLKLNAGATLPIVVGGVGNVTLNGTSQLFVSRNSGTMDITRTVVLHDTAALVLGGGGTANTSTVASPIQWNGTAHTLNLQNAGNAYISTGTWSGGGNISKTGPGSITISGANTGLTGNWTMGGGTVRVSNASLPLGTGSLTFTAPTTLATATGGPAVSLPNPIQINAGIIASVDGGFADLTLGGLITGTGSLAKNSTGNVIISGANPDLSGTVTLNGGIVAIGDNSSLGTGAVDLHGGGIASMDSNGRVLGNAMTLTGNTTFGSAGTGDLYLAGTFSAGITAMTVTVSNTLTNVFSGISGGDPAVNLTKTGTGELMLSGDNTFTSGFAVNGGKLTLDYTNGDTSKLADAAPLLLGNGTLNLAAGSHIETVASTTLTGNSRITRSSGSALLNLNAITRNAGATIDFQTENLAITDTLNDASGILGSWATVGGTDWAMNVSNTEDGLVGAFTSYENVLRQGGQIVGSFEGSPATHVKIQDNVGSGSITLFSSGTSDILTLINGSSAGTATVDLGTNVLRLSATGAVFNPATSGALVISGGTLTAGGAADTAGTLTVNNESTTQPVTISSVIANNGTGVVGLTKMGAGPLVLSGANTYTGATGITAGTLVLANGLALQNTTVTPIANSLVFDSSVASHAFSIGGLGGAAGIVLQDNAVAPNPVALSVGTGDVTSSYSGILSGPGTLIKKGTGSFSLRTANAIGLANTTIDVQGGTFRFDTALATANLTPNAGVIVKANAGTTVSLQQTQNSGYVAARNWTLGSQVTLNGGTLTGGSTNGGQFQRLLAATAIQVDAASTISQGSGGFTQNFTIEGTVTGTGDLKLDRADTNARYLNLKGSFAAYSGNVSIDPSTATGYVILGHSTGWGSGDLTLTGAGSNLVLGDEAATAYRAEWTGGTALAFTAGTLAPAGDITVGPGSLLRLYNNTAATAILLEPHGAMNINGGTLGLIGTAGTSAFVPAAGSTWNFGGTALSTVSGKVALGNTGVTFAVADALVGDRTDAVVSGVISGANGFTKSGPGALALTGANTYTGATTVSAGTLAVTSTPGSTMSVANGATLAVNGTVGHVDISPGGTISPDGPPATNNALARAVITTTNVTVTATGDFQELHNTTGTIIPNNTTYLYTGQIYLPGAAGAIYYFGENFDDSIALKINGSNVLVPNGSATISAGSFTSPGPGWYSISLEAANGAGATGPVTATGWGPGKGVGFATVAPTTATDGSFYSAFTLENLTTAGIQLRSASGVAECVAGATIGGIYRCDVNQANADKLVVTGDLNITGATLAVNPVGSVAAGTYVIATYTGSLTGTFAAVQAPAGYSVNYNTGAKQVELVYNGAASGFATWIAGYPGLSDITPGGDPDHDGITNLMEYVLGGDPSVSGTAVLPVQTMDATNVTFTFKRRDDSESDTTQKVQWSTNLTGWTDIAIGAGNSSGVTIAENGASPDDVTVVIPRSNASPDGKLFVRLRVTTP